MEYRDAYGDIAGEYLYLVRETKALNWKTDIRPE
jgi:hypothetical protein